MKLLLDECVNHHLRGHIRGHDVESVRYRGWAGIANGKLLQLAAEAGFDALLTTDRGYEHQHNRDTLPIAVVILSAASNDIEDLLPLLPQLERVLSDLPTRVFTTVNPPVP